MNRQVPNQTKYHGVVLGTTIDRCMDTTIGAVPWTLPWVGALGTASRVPHTTIGWCLPHHDGMDRQDTPDSSGRHDNTRYCINV